MGSGSNGYGVKTSTLVSAGDEFVDIGDDAAEAAAEFIGKVEAHNGANNGFAGVSAADSLVKPWHRQVDDLAKRTSVAGELLQASSDNYEKMEQSVLDTLPPLGEED